MYIAVCLHVILLHRSGISKELKNTIAIQPAVIKSIEYNIYPSDVLNNL